MAVRPGTPGDHPWVVEACRGAFGSERQAVSHRGLFVVTDFPLLVAERGGERAGFLAFDVDGGVCEVVTVAAEPTGAGVGRALMEAVHEEAAGQGCSELRLVTTAENTGARRFYERLGYAVVEIRPGAVDECRQRYKPEIPEGIHDEVVYGRSVRP